MEGPALTPRAVPAGGKLRVHHIPSDRADDALPRHELRRGFGIHPAAQRPGLREFIRGATVGVPAPFSQRCDVEAADTIGGEGPAHHAAEGGVATPDHLTNKVVDAGSGSVGQLEHRCLDAAVAGERDVVRAEPPPVGGGIVEERVREEVARLVGDALGVREAAAHLRVQSTAAETFQAMQHSLLLNHSRAMALTAKPATSMRTTLTSGGASASTTSSRCSLVVERKRRIVSSG